jgi:hypothetical protein
MDKFKQIGNDDLEGQKISPAQKRWEESRKKNEAAMNSARNVVIGTDKQIPMTVIPAKINGAKPKAKTETTSKVKTGSRIYPLQVEVKSVSEELRDNIRKYAATGHAGISTRIRELEREWTREKVLEVNLSAFALLGIAFSLISPLFLLVSAIMLVFFLQQASQGWCPPLLLLRWLKLRSRQEIEREKYCLKVIRGDFRQFADITPVKPQLKARHA